MEDPENVLRQDTGYAFDAEQAALVVPLIDQAFSVSGSYSEAHRLLRISVAEQLGRSVDELDFGHSDSGGTDRPDENDHQARASESIRHELDRALMYQFVVPFDGPVTCEIGHEDRTSGFVWPPRIEHVTVAVVDLWEYLAEWVSAPGAAARFHDLAFTRGRDRFSHAIAARDAYLDCAALSSVVDLDQAHALLRAWAIDRIFGRTAELERTREAIGRAITAAWDAGERAAGVLLPLLGALCATNPVPEDGDSVPVDALLHRASGLYGFSDSISYIANLRRERARSDTERNAISEWQIEQLATVARASEGFVKAMRLSEAIREAGRLQVPDLEASLIVELQSLPPADTKLESISADVRVSRVPLERFFRQFTRDRDWRPGFGQFSHLPPPTGSLEELQRSAEQRRLHPRLMDVISTVVLDEDRMPSWQPTTDEERREYQIARDASYRAAVAGSHLAEILDRLKDKYGIIPVEDLAPFICHEGRGNFELAAVFSRALHHYWNEDLEACIHIAVPRTESAARLILRELDIAIYRVQLGRRPGLYPQLGSLLDEFEGLGFDESWVYFLRWLLTEPTGKNLRNQVAHGRVRAATKSDAALVLRALLLLALLCGPGDADDIQVDLSEARQTTGSKPEQTKDNLGLNVGRPVAGMVEYPALPLVLADQLLNRCFAALSRRVEKSRRSRGENCRSK